jgi:hypothetical protein
MYIWNKRDSFFVVQNSTAGVLPFTALEYRVHHFNDHRSVGLTVAQLLHIK